MFLIEFKFLRYQINKYILGTRTVVREKKTGRKRKIRSRIRKKTRLRKKTVEKQNRYFTRKYYLQNEDEVTSGNFVVADEQNCGRPSKNVSK